MTTAATEETSAPEPHPAAERLSLSRPVRRLAHLSDRVAGRRVLDLGCYDETALVKKGTGSWLHEELGKTAASLVGVDASSSIPDAGIDTGFSVIHRGDAYRLDPEVCGDPEVIVAGELIEHVPDPVAFVTALRTSFPDAEVILTTPNTTAITNVWLAPLRRESMHPDHLFVMSFTSLQTTLSRAGATDAVVRPYHTSYAEFRTGSKLRRVIGGIAEGTVRLVERVIPLWSGGFVAELPPASRSSAGPVE